MNEYNEKIKVAEDYIDSIYRIESIRALGMSAMYGLEQDRIKKHEQLCDIMRLDREKTKDICLDLYRSIGFDITQLESDYAFYLEKYAKKLISHLTKLE